MGVRKPSERNTPARNRRSTPNEKNTPARNRSFWQRRSLRKASHPLQPIERSLAWMEDGFLADLSEEAWKGKER
jgi:hypothetical protein